MSAARVPLGGGTRELAGLLAPWIARQDWAQSALGVLGSRRVPVRTVDLEVLRPGRPGLASVIVDAGQDPTSRLHVLVGWRDVAQATATLLRPGAVFGSGADGEGSVLLYDALADAELCLELLGAVTGGRERAARVRVVHSLASHASLVFDERLFMKSYRVIERRTRPEIEVMEGLDRVGFNHLLAPVAHWSRAGGDLALVREFLPGAVEGKALALTSLRDLLARATGEGDGVPSFEEVGLAGGDLGDEMRRLGRTTAELHLALAEAFGVESRSGSGPPLIRIHGDYHLRRVMRVEAGWLVAGFGDDPLTGRDAGAASQADARRAEAVADLAELCESLRLVAAEAVSVQTPATLDLASAVAAGWVRHNTRAFLSGYLDTDGIARLAPGTADDLLEKVASYRQR
ncbi:MAG TPA: hypothetical protein VKU92_04135 [Acidimicrobiales bacterium]|nr:hypothetical protein [Acidimicrobiales bacterium]